MLLKPRRHGSLLCLRVPPGQRSPRPAAGRIGRGVDGGCQCERPHACAHRTRTFSQRPSEFITRSDKNLRPRRTNSSRPLGTIGRLQVQPHQACRSSAAASTGSVREIHASLRTRHECRCRATIQNRKKSEILAVQLVGTCADPYTWSALRCASRVFFRTPGSFHRGRFGRATYSSTRESDTSSGRRRSSLEVAVELAIAKLIECRALDLADPLAC